ncbi:MAG: hypothetical protein PCFJNLEI_00683 [Verrucomicrobiae bacterium]|nr:hypothetical protein [Verrucomicrobiae bacterium]
MTATEKRCPPFAAAGIGTTINPNRRRDNSPSPLEQAKSAVTIFTVWHHFGFPSNPENGHKVSSPFRPDRHPSFTVTKDGRRFKDWSTGDAGDVVAFVALATGLGLSDAAKWLIEYAVTGHSAARVTSFTSVPRPAPHSAQRQKPGLPPMQRGDDTRLQVVAQFRNVSMEGLQLADERGLLHFALLHNLSAWIVKDSEGVNAQARLMDGGLWQHLSAPAKAYTLPGCWAAWPIGIAEAKDFPVIALVEGGPDLLAAHHFIYAEERECDVAAVAMLGASQRIHESALPLFSGKRVRIYPHLDDAGRKAAARWTEQLESINADVDCCDLSGISTVTGGCVKDLNDLTQLDAETFESDRELWRILP